MSGEYITIQRKGGYFLNFAPDYLYISDFFVIRKYHSSGYYLDRLTNIGNDIGRLGKILFYKENLKTDVSVDNHKFRDLINLNKIQDIIEEPVRIKEYDIIVYRGDYYTESATKAHLFFWLNNDEIVFTYENEEKRLPLSRVYVLSRYTSYGNDPVQFRRLDYIKDEFVNTTFRDFEDPKLIFDLSLRIIEINEKFSVKLKTLISKSKKRANNFAEASVLERMKIICIAGTFTFYPIIIPFSFSLQGSLFNITSWERDTLTLDYDVEDVKSLFHIFMQNELPNVNDLLRDGLLSLYAELSEYIGMAFYSDYFSAITNTIEYRVLIIPQTGSVDDYLAFLGNESLELQYTKFSPRVNDKNFYVAIHEKGLSSSYMAKDMRRNPSRALQEFVDEYY